MFRPVNTKNHPNDRFIPRRMEITFDFFANETQAITDVADVDKEAPFINYAKIRYNRINYQNALRNILLPLDVKVLNFFPPKISIPDKIVSQTDQVWPVKPRKKPVIGPPEVVLDMPHFDSNISHHVADWSSKNCLATIFENEVHMWYPESEFLRAATDTQRRVQHCVKWKSDGIRFAVGLYPNRVGIWDILTKKLICETLCCLPCCEVLCLEWIGEDRLITGCSKGVLRLNSSNLKCLKKVRNAHDCSIINIVSSCNKNFIATSSMDNNVIVWKVPQLTGHFQIEFITTVRALAWHPWANSLLAIGHGYNQGHVIVWNVNTHKQIAREKTTYKNSSIDCLTFNPLSGELVVSYFVHCTRDRTKGSGIISVLTNIDNVVEEMHMHDGPIPYLLWGNGGKTLASASADENLCIWDFFGTPSKEKKKSRVKTHNSTIFRTYIR
ncbi:protein cortex-like [Tenebrio molitor]|uniref:protein cortex-like n=1 Tax=Tenebrio molitor TaxID=7067 RepID=UPI001C3BA424|nr:unnamed protein product [Tenebrio molitor]